VVNLETESDIRQIIDDKRIFLLNEWLIDHPNSKVINYRDLSYIINKSRVAQGWLKEANLKYTALSEMPDWVLDDIGIRSMWNENYTSQMAVYKVAMREASKAKSDAAEEMRRKVDEANNRFTKILYQIADSNLLVLINKISVDALPLDLIEPTLSMGDDQAKEQLEVILSKYKKQIARKFLDGEYTKEEVIQLLKDR
jgi:hypothetical protein